MDTLPFWITCVVAFLTAVLSGLGLGSAGLFVLYLTMVAHFPQQEAQGMNLLFYLFSAGIALLFHVRHRVVPIPLVIYLVLCAIPGSVAGTWLMHVLEMSLVRKLFGGMLIVTGLPALLRWERKKNVRAQIHTN